MLTFDEIASRLNDFAWGPLMLVLLVGTGIYISIRTGFLQFRKFGYVFKNTLGKMFRQRQTGEGEISPLQAVTTALAATVGTGNIAGVTGAIVTGGPGAVFWMWLSALFGMMTKYAEVVLAIRFRERNEKGDWVGGPMYYIQNGLGKNWKWLAAAFCLLGSLAAFGIGNMTQVNTIASAVNGALDSYGANTSAHALTLFGQSVPVSSIVVGCVLSAVVGLVLFGGIKRIGSVTEKLVPVMAVIYILGSLTVIVFNGAFLGEAFGLIFRGAFSAKAALGGVFGITLRKTIQLGVGRGVFSNEAGLGSAPIAYAASSESDPVKQGVYGIFEVFMDTIIICSMTALVLLTSYLKGGISFEWGSSGGTELISGAFGAVFGERLGATLVAFGLMLFALSTTLSWSLYGTRCFEYLFGTKASRFYKAVFVLVVIVGSTLQMKVVWNIADTLNGFMAIPNLVALLGLSGVVVRVTREHFPKEKGKQ